MKAFQVSYLASGETNTIMTLAENESKLEEAISQKDKNYKIGSLFSRVVEVKEIPLSTVKVNELSVTELLGLLNTGNTQFQHQ